MFIGVISCYDGKYVVGDHVRYLYMNVFCFTKGNCAYIFGEEWLYTFCPLALPFLFDSRSTFLARVIFKSNSGR